MTFDQELIARIRERDAHALTELYERYANRVYSLAIAIVGGRETAQEVTQDTFLKVWRHPEHYRSDQGHFAAWLLTIARHCAIDRLRQRKRRGAHSLSLDDPNLPEMGNSVQDSETRWQELRYLLDELPREQREVIVLAFYQGMSQREIAAYLHLPLGTVKTRLRLGMQKLRDAWLTPARDPKW